MKSVLALIPAFLGLLLLAAHFLRAGLPILTLALLCTLPLLFIRQRWSGRFLQSILALGGFVWIHTLVTIVQTRRAFGESWGRAALIIGIVILVTVLAALLFETRTLKNRFRL